MTTKTSIILRGISENFIELSDIIKFTDGHGYESRLSIHSGEFSCSNHPFYFNDLQSFTENIKQAYDKIEGIAQLGNVYEQDFIEIYMKRNGVVEVNGFVYDYKQPGQEMRFAFNSDQTFLPELIRALKQVSIDLEDSA